MVRVACVNPPWPVSCVHGHPPAALPVFPEYFHPKALRLRSNPLIFFQFPFGLLVHRIKVKTGGSNKRSREDAEGDGGEAEEKEEPGGEKAMKRILDSLHSSLRVVTNFGLVDICPLRSGKHNAAAYLAREHFEIPLANCASMGDDDNDIALVNIDSTGGGEGTSFRS